MKISVIIPTRERASYLKYALQTALSINDPDVEIVVSDNASSDDTAQMVAAFNDPRVVYTNTGARVSMRENFNHAFLASSGEYVIYFGDDDGILPGQFKFLRQLLKEHRPDGLSWQSPRYGWPIKKFGKKTGGIRTFRAHSFGAAQPYDPASQRTALLQCDMDRLRPLPEVYHGCMSRDYLIRTATAPDLVFDSAVPDYNIVYRAILKGGNFIQTDHCFSINGYSPASTGGGQNAARKPGGDTSTSTTFEVENRADHLEDVVGYASSVPLAFFSTLETIRERHGLTQYAPNYRAWFRYVLSSASKNPDLKAELLDVLGRRADETQSRADLEHAKGMRPLRRRSWAERWERLAMTPRSFRVSCAQDDKNTILTAVRVLDSIYGDNYGAVLTGEKSAAAAWRAAAARSKQYQGKPTAPA